MAILMAEMYIAYRPFFPMIRIRGRLPHAFIDNNHAYFRVYIDGKEIYHYTADDTPAVSKSPGNAYSMISLPQNCKGKELVLEFYPTLKVNVEYWVEDILFADYTSFMRLQFLTGFRRTSSRFYAYLLAY